MTAQQVSEPKRKLVPLAAFAKAYSKPENLKHLIRVLESMPGKDDTPAKPNR